MQPLIFGEVLYDCFPDGTRVLGGAPFNVAWHLRGFGADPLLVTRVGHDDSGRSIRRAAEEWGLRSDGIHLDDTRPTGHVDIELHDGEPSYEIPPEQAWDHIDATALLPIAVDTIVYHGTLALRSAPSRACWRQLAVGRRFVDLNLRDPWWDRSLVDTVLDGVHWLKVSEAEAAVVAGTDARTRAEDLCRRIGAAAVIVTRGARGARAATGDGLVREVDADRTRVVDPVGAGDAFSAVALYGIIAGWDLATLMSRARAFAAAILGVRGAIVRERSFYLQATEDWIR